MWSKSRKMLLSYADAYNFALDRLAVRDYSSRELREKLRTRGCPKEMEDRVIFALQEHHFIDDERCAGLVLDSWRHKKYYGRQYLRLMMSKRQIPSSLITEKVTEISDQEEYERAKSLIDEQLPKLRRKYSEKNKVRAAAARMLSTRGFSSGIISKVLSFYEEDPEID
jgi:regulatory protein